MKWVQFRWRAESDSSIRASFAVLLIILAAVAIRSMLLAIVRPFWYDEVVTVFICRLPGMQEIVGALNHAVDNHPPLFYFLERVGRYCVHEDHLGYRLPSLLASLVTISCIYFTLSKRVSRLSALAGAAFMLCTPVIIYYSGEARPYALLVCFCSLAILAWQRIDSSRFYALLLASALAFAASLHYYAILAWPAFLTAEAAIWLFDGRFRPRAWVSILAGALPLAFEAGILLRMRAYYAPHFWAQPSLKDALLAHDWLFNMGQTGGHWGWTYAVGISMVLASSATWERKRKKLPDRGSGLTNISLGELTLTLMLLWLPLFAYAAAAVGHGGMAERYVLPATLGGALALGFAIEKCPPAGRVLLLVLLCVQFASSSVSLAEDALHHSLLDEREGQMHQIESAAKLANDPTLAVVVADDLYLPMAYYTSADLQSEVFAVADPSSNLTLDDNLRALRHYAPLQVEDYGNFVSSHRDFLLIADDDPESTWPTNRLIQDGFAVTLISHASPEQENEVYRVTRK